MTEVHHVTPADMHREPLEAWRADRLYETIRLLRLEIVRLKIKCGETISLEDCGLPSNSIKFENTK